MLKLNSNKLIKDICKSLDDEFDKVADTLIEYMIYDISNIPTRGSIEAVGKPDWRLDVIEALRHVTKYEGLDIIKQIGLIDQSKDIVMKAMIVEFGMGKEADKNNPWLSEYFETEFYHSERGGMNVYGRKGKEVYDIDENQWFESTAKHNDEIDNFRQKGSNFWSNVFGGAATLARNEIEAAKKRVLDKIDFSKYLENV